ncbi:gluconate:H+ symporter [Micropruina sp.]|uniref:GntT/GntP/DsdX family permease n=1 Tax=Micropruina sp. TaxID=2737536 RepID=UPI0039E551C1
MHALQLLPLAGEVGSTQLVIAALVGVASIILLITVAKLNPFLSLMAGSAIVAAIAGVGVNELFKSFVTGFGSTLGGVGILIGLGALVGKLLVDSEGANAVVDKILGSAPLALVPWAVTLIAFIVGIPMFFEIGLVLLMPIIVLTARRGKLPIMLIGIPVLAALGQMHALMPPHPGPLAVIDALHADLGLTMLIGFALAIPVIIVAGPLFAPIAARWVPAMAPEQGAVATTQNTTYRRPSFGVTLATILLPVVLMLARTVSELTLPAGSPVRTALEFVGTPVVALFITALMSLITLGVRTGRSMSEVGVSVSASFGPVAGILLIVGAGGGFKQTLVDLGVGKVVAEATSALSLSPLLVAFVLAALVRIATGSATVAALTAAGLALPLAEGLSPVQVAMLVLAVGLGSGVLSHVNDAGFWLIKEFFGLTVVETFKTWTVLTIIAPLVGMVLLFGVWSFVS